MEIKLSREEKINIFHTALCNGINFIGDYGLILEFDSTEYEKAKENLSTKDLNFICREDVWIEMLKMGYSLTFTDYEIEDEYTAIISLQDVLHNIEKTPTENILNIQQGQDDAYDADAVIQSVLYGEIIFG